MLEKKKHDAPENTPHGSAVYSVVCWFGIEMGQIYNK